MKKRCAYLIVILFIFWSRYNFCSVPDQNESGSFFKKTCLKTGAGPFNFTDFPADVFWNIIDVVYRHDSIIESSMLLSCLRCVHRKTIKALDEKKSSLNKITLKQLNLAKSEIELLELFCASYKDELTSHKITPLNFIISILSSYDDSLFRMFYRIIDIDNVPYFIQTKFFPKAQNITSRSKPARIWDVPDGNGLFPLDIAILCNKEEIFKILLQRGADPNKVYNGRTTLMVAAKIAYYNPFYLLEILSYNAKHHIDNKPILNYFDKKYNTLSVLSILIQKLNKTNLPQEISRLKKAIQVVASYIFEKK